ncbi:MAG: hypothetical protein AAB152_03945 [Candidatus Coatesbacteria bacterium]
MAFAPWLAAVWGLLVWGNWYRVNCALDHPAWLDHVRQAFLLWTYVDTRSLAAWGTHLGQLALLGVLGIAAAGAGERGLNWCGRRGRDRGILDATALGAGLAALAMLGAGLAGLARFLPVAAVVAVAGVAGLPSARRAGRRGWDAFRRTDAGTRWIALGLAAALAVPLLGALAPETSVDAQLHHLAQPALFASLGRIVALPFNEFSLHPALVHMQFLIAFVLGGGEVVAKLVHFGWGVLVAALVAVWAGRRLGARWGLAASAAFVLLPYTQVVAIRAYVELATVAYLTLLIRDLVAPGANPVLVGVWGGLCAGTKVNGLMAPALAAGALALRRAPWRVWGAWALAGTAAVAPWAVKNALACGNPTGRLLPGVFPTMWLDPENLRRHVIELVGAGREPMALPGAAGLLARPWNVSILNTGVMDPHSGMGGWFLWIAPFCLLASGVGPLAALVGGGLVLWQIMPHLVRYSMPLWPAMSVLGAQGLRALSARGSGGRAVVAAAGLVLAVHLPLAVAREFSIANPFGVVFGLETRNHYLARGFPERGRTVAAQAWLAPEIGRSRVLLLTPTGLWLHWGPRTVVQSLFDTALIERFAREERDAAGIAKRFRQTGIGWTIYLPQSGWALERTYGTWAFEEGAAARWRAFWETRAVLAHAEGDRIVIHRLLLGGSVPPNPPDGYLPGLDERWLAETAGLADRGDPGVVGRFEAIARATGSAAAWEQAAAAILKAGDEKKALAAFREAERRGRRTVATAAAVGMLEARAGRLRPAADALDIAVAIDPSREDIRLLDVRVLLGLRRLQDAARVLDDGLKLNPGSAALGAAWRDLTGRPYLR